VLVAGTMLYGRGNSRRLEEEQQQMQEQQPELEEQEPMLQETLAVASAAAGGVHVTGVACMEAAWAIVKQQTRLHAMASLSAVVLCW
jgi:hypothetical protein